MTRMESSVMGLAMAKGSVKGSVTVMDWVMVTD